MRPPSARVSVVERARTIAVVGVTAEGIAAEIGIGERHRADLHLQDAALALPIELAVQAVERKARLRKHARQLDLGAARLQVQPPARLRRLDRAGKLGEARQRLARLEPQIEEAGAGAVLRRRRDCALPFEAHVAELAARLELEGEPAHIGGQRQCFGEVRERRELQRIRAHHAALRLPGELEIDWRQRRATRRRERQLARRQLVAVGAVARLQPPAERAELERRQRIGEFRLDAGERHVGGGLARRAALDGGPQPHCALTVLQLERVIEPGPPCGEVGIAELGIDLTADLRKAAADKLGAQLEARAERFRQPAGEPDRMALAVVLQAQVDRREHERRRGALLVAPLDFRVAHLDVVLAEQPVAEAALVGRGELHPGDVERPRAVAAHGEPRPFDAQRVQPQPPVSERAP